ncbi:MAG: M23 family metallopeptidase [Armatimonadetes bacterium]|nr:M23 family metallopeptidase [Armatimonadota bacterium]
MPKTPPGGPPRMVSLSSLGPAVLGVELRGPATSRPRMSMILAKSRAVLLMDIAASLRRSYGPTFRQADWRAQSEVLCQGHFSFRAPGILVLGVLLFLGTFLTLSAAAPLGALPAASAAAEPITIELSRHWIRQGGALRLFVRTTVPAERLEIRFAGRRWPAYRAGDSGWRTILGTDPDTPPGRHALTVEAFGPGLTGRTYRRTVTVGRVPFPRREITFDPALAPLLTPQAAERERRRVAQALQVLHPSQLWTDPLALPIRGVLTSEYGVLSIYQGQVRGFHGGVDIKAPQGTPVRSAGRGIVRLAEPLPLSGHAVLVDHGLGVVTSYLHMSEIGARVGQRVARGEVLGRVGSTGLSTGPHLHWGLRVNGTKVDPIPWTVR